LLGLVPVFIRNQNSRTNSSLPSNLVACLSRCFCRFAIPFDQISKYSVLSCVISPIITPICVNLCLNYPEELVSNLTVFMQLFCSTLTELTDIYMESLNWKMPCNPIWNFFEKLECDRSRALCQECGNTLSLGSDKPKRQSVTGLKGHLRTHHKTKYKLFLDQLAYRDSERTEKSAKRMKQESPEYQCPEMYEMPDLSQSVMPPETITKSLHSYHESDVQNGYFTGVLLTSFCRCLLLT